MIELKITGVMLTICMPAYMILFRVPVEKIRANEKKYWNDIGSPAPSDPDGQVIILRELLINPKSRMPADIYMAYKNYIKAIQALGLISIVLMGAAIFFRWR